MIELRRNSRKFKSTLKNEALKKYLPARYSYDSLEYDINETNSYDINDILAAYARVGQKPKKILKELLASGDIDEWAKECACSTEELYSSIEESMYDYDDTSSITLEGRDGDTAKCKVVLPDEKAFTVYIPVYDLDDDDDMDENLNRNNNIINKKPIKEYKNMINIKRSRKLESVSPTLSKEECCDYILNYINSIREYVKDIDVNLQWLKQTSWDDEDYSKINSFIQEDKDDIYSKLKDIEFCLKKI